MRSAASIPSICGIVISISTISGFTRSYSVMAVRPSPASPAICPPNCSTILAMFLRAKTESSTTRNRSGCRSLLRNSAEYCSIQFLLIATSPAQPAGYLNFHRDAGYGRALRLQRVRHRIEWHHSDRMPTLDRRLWHPEHDARIFALRDRHAAGSFDGRHAFRTIFAHARHDHCERVASELLCDGTEQHIHRRTVSIHTVVVAQDDNVAHRHTLDLDVPVAGTDQRAAGDQQISRLRFLHVDSATFVEAACKQFSEAFRHVLHYNDAAGKITRQLRKHVLQRVGPAGGDADSDHFRRRPLRFGTGLRRALRFHQYRRGIRTLQYTALAGDLDLPNQFFGNIFHVRRSGVFGLGDEVERARCQSLERR